MCYITQENASFLKNVFIQTPQFVILVIKIFQVYGVSTPHPPSACQYLATILPRFPSHIPATGNSAQISALEKCNYIEQVLWDLSK